MNNGKLCPRCFKPLGVRFHLWIHDSKWCFNCRNCGEFIGYIDEKTNEQYAVYVHNKEVR